MRYELHASIPFLYCFLLLVVPASTSASPYDCDGVWSSVPCEERVVAPSRRELQGVAIDPVSKHMHQCNGIWSSHPCAELKEEAAEQKLAHANDDTSRKPTMYLCKGRFQRTPCLDETASEDVDIEPTKADVLGEDSAVAEEEGSFALDSAGDYRCSLDDAGAAISIRSVEAKRSGTTVLLTGSIINSAAVPTTSPVYVQVLDAAKRPWITKAARPMKPGAKVSFALTYRGFEEVPDWLSLSLIYSPAALCPQLVVEITR